MSSKLISSMILAYIAFRVKSRVTTVSASVALLKIEAFVLPICAMISEWEHSMIRFSLSRT